MSSSGFIASRFKKTYPDLAHFFAQLLSPASEPQPSHVTNVKEATSINIFKPSAKPIPGVKQFSCVFTDYKSFDSLSQPTVQKLKPGLASSLCLFYFLQTPSEIENIVYDRKKETFFNISRERVFNECWVPKGVSHERGVEPEFDLENLFAQFRFDTALLVLNEAALKDSGFLLELYQTCLAFILCPFKELAKILTPTHFDVKPEVYEQLAELQSQLEPIILLNKSFREFLFSQEGIKFATDIFVTRLNFELRTKRFCEFELKDGKSYPKEINIEKARQITTPQKLTEYVLANGYFFDSDKLEIVIEIVNDLQTKCTIQDDDCVVVDQPSQEDYSKLKIIEALILTRKGLSAESKKEIAKDLITEEIERQTTLKGVFEIVVRLEEQHKYSDISKRNSSFPVSLKGSGIKLESGENKLVSNTMNQLRAFAKEKMMKLAEEYKKYKPKDIGISEVIAKENNVAALLQNKDYCDFLSSHLNAYWCGQDSFLKYLIATRSAKWLKAKKIASGKEEKSFTEQTRFDRSAIRNEEDTIRASSTPEDLLSEPEEDAERYSFATFAFNFVTRMVSSTPQQAPRVTPVSAFRAQVQQGIITELKNTVTEVVKSTFR